MKLKMFHCSTMLVNLLQLVILCHCLKLTVSGLHEESCPEKCTCSKYYRRVSCIGKNFTEIPEGIPDSVTELYLSQNKIQLIPNKTFSQLRGLKILSLERNIISKIESKAFDGLSYLEILYLSQNKLTTLQPNTFSGLPGLKKVYLSQNQLQKIPDLGSLKNMSRLNLDSNRIQSATFPDSFSKTVNLTSVNLAHNNITLLRSKDLQSLITTKLAKLDLSNCAMKSIESGVFENLRSLQSLVLSYNPKLSIESLTNAIASLSNSTLNSLSLSQAVNGILPPSIFSPLMNVPLRTLSLNHIEVTVFLVNGTFTSINKLMNLYMSYSMIQFVEPGTLSVLNDLISFDISHSNLVVCPTNLPASLKNIDLSYNPQLKVLPDHVFRNNSVVEKIDFSHCAIASISKKAFYGLRKVSFIDLSHNLLAENSIAIDSFRYLSTLLELDLGHNVISHIKTESLIFQGLEHLQILRLDSNNCEYLPLTILHPLINLRKLYLQGNKFGQLIGMDTDGTFLKHQVMLEMLELSMNDIHVLHNKTFQTLLHLTSLWLRNNLVSFWDYSTFANVSKLSILDLSYNSISVLRQTDIQYFNDGLVINLTGNPFNCWCDLSWFRTWFNTTGVIFSENQTYLCQSPKQFQGTTFLNFSPLSIETKCNPPYLKYILIPCGCLAVIMIILFIVIYLKRWSILLKWYKLKKSCRQCCCGRPGDVQITSSSAHTMTVSYGPDEHDSVEWVQTKLSQKLKNMNKSCFTEEDVLPGMGLSDQIGMYYEALCNCDYVMLVLSQEYLKNGRRRLEMDTALECRLQSESNLPIIVTLFVNEESEAVQVWDKCPKWMRTVFPRGLEDSHMLQWIKSQEQSQELFWDDLQQLLLRVSSVEEDHAPERC